MKTNILKIVLPAVGLLAMAGSVHAADAPYCREFSQQIVVGGKAKQGYGTACLQPNGSWQIVTPAQPGDEVQPLTVVAPQPQPQVQYVVQQPVYQPVYAPAPVAFSFGIDDMWGDHGWHGGGWHGGGWHR